MYVWVWQYILGVTYSAREHFHPDWLTPGSVRAKVVEAQIDEPVPCTQKQESQ